MDLWSSAPACFWALIYTTTVDMMSVYKVHSNNRHFLNLQQQIKIWWYFLSTGKLYRDSHGGGGGAGMWFYYPFKARQSAHRKYPMGLHGLLQDEQYTSL
jgi:hypothetical protein